MCTVMNLKTTEKFYYTCLPREAVIACYAQNLMDWNTWDYKMRYDHLVIEGNYTLGCGDFSTFKDGREF